LTDLSQVGCRNTLDPLTFRAEAGTTYYFQVGGDGESVQFRLDVSPLPSVGYFFYPSEPSVFDLLTFYDQSYDPANVGIESYAWDFGDGTTSADPNPSHRYTQDGDYTVQHSATTYDGRSASASQVVQVRTHDVAITKILAPISANAGQTRTITVYVSNKWYPENVEVALYKSVPGGYQWVTSDSKLVPVRSGNRTTMITFKYTFTTDDASAKLVTFKAIATIDNVRDALPDNNEIISSPATKVPR
jgi:PKD repeat protein